jgi:hypothetical protein
MITVIVLRYFIAKARRIISAALFYQSDSFC